MKRKLGQSAEYEAAKKVALEILKEEFDLQYAPPASRDELHDREAARRELQRRYESA
jgi:hypothetical protein